MTSVPSGPALPALNTRGSTHIGSSGLFVLGLGSLVLLTGLATPDGAANDAAFRGGSSVASSPLLPQWLAGAAMIGVALVAMGLRRHTDVLPAGEGPVRSR